MKQDRQHKKLIELGAASVETKGPTSGRDDVGVGRIPFAGISND